MSIFKLPTLAFLLTFGALTSTAQKTVKFDYQVSQARLLEASPNAYMRPLVAEIKVDESQGRIRDKWHLTPSEFASRAVNNNDEATILNLKSYALFKSSEKHNCDMIIVPTFDIHITDEGAEISVAGYPANFDKWTTGTTADYDWILLERGEQKITKENSSIGK